MASRVFYNGLVQGQITTGTKYLKADGTLSTTGGDAWLRRDDQQATYLLGMLAGGTTAVTVEMSRGVENVPSQPGDTRLAFPVDQESPNVAASLAAGVEVQTPYPFIRVKVVQTTASTTTAFLFVD